MPSRDDLRTFIEQHIPFNRHLGLRADHWEDGVARMTLPVRPELVGDPFRPALHGGAIAALIDACAGLAVFSKLDLGTRISTVDMRVDFLRPGRTDLDVVADARVVRLGNRVAVTDIHVHQGDPDAPIAEGRAVYNVSRPEDA
jgi:uncharacterized protein (TIGR00369 family)